MQAHSRSSGNPRMPQPGLVAHRSVAAADAQVRGFDHHRHYGLPGVELVEVPVASVGRGRDDDNHGGGGAGDMAAPLPDLRQLFELVTVNGDDEVTMLAVVGRRRQPTGLQYAFRGARRLSAGQNRRGHSP